MKAVVTYTKLDDDNKPIGTPVEEEMQVTSQESATTDAMTMFSHFNQTLRPGENRRKPLKIVLYSGADETPHEWEKTSLVTEAGGYDKMRCKRCGVTGKRYGLGQGSVQIDGRYKAKKYQFCEGKLGQTGGTEQIIETIELERPRSERKEKVTTPDQLLPKLTETEAWAEMCKRCRDGVRRIRNGQEMLVEGYWMVGSVLLEYRKDGGRLGAYGDNVVNQFAADAQLHRQSLYQAVDFANDFGTWNDALGLLDNLEAAGFSRTWTSVRNRHRLLGAPDPITDPKQADKVGGRDAQVDHLIRSLEVAKDALVKYKDHGIPEEYRTEVAGAIAQFSLEGVPLAEEIEPGVIFSHVTSPDGEDEQEPARPAQAITFQDIPYEGDLTARVYEFIITRPCTGCGDPSVGLLSFPDDNPDRPDHHRLGVCQACLEEGQKNRAAFWGAHRHSILSWLYDTVQAAVKENIGWREIAGGRIDPFTEATADADS